MPNNFLKISVKLNPASKTNEVIEFTEDMNGLYSMKARVKAPPQEGKANQALIKLIAEYLDVPKSKVDIISGATIKQKVIRVVDFDDKIIVKKVQKNLFS